MAILTISTVSPALCEKPQSYVACGNDFAATAIQTAARVYLAKKEWEYLYVRHIENEILRLQDASRSKRQRARKRKILDQTATVIQTLARGYLVRNRYRESDKMLRNNATRGLSLMESVRKRMDIRKKIEALKQQLSEVREARNTHSDDDDENDDREKSSNNNVQQYTDQVSVRKVEELKAIQHKLKIKAKTLEVFTRPLQEKFDGLRAEHEKLMKKYGKIESKNESCKYSNETKAELLAEKQKLLRETCDKLAFTEDGVSLERERSKAQKRLDTLVETSSAYARLGMNERDAAAFANEVTRIGREAHRKAKLFRDSLRMASNLTKSWSSRSLTSNTVDTTAAVATTRNKTMPTITKEELREECTKDGRKSRSKSRERKNSVEPRRLKSKKKSINRKTKSKSPSDSASPKGNNGRSVVGISNSKSPRSNNRSVQFSESVDLLRGKRPTYNNYNEADTPEQPKRHVSLTAPKLDVRRNKTYLRRTISLTESSKYRRKLVDECIDSGGMIPHLV